MKKLFTIIICLFIFSACSQQTPPSNVDSEQLQDTSNRSISSSPSAQQINILEQDISYFPENDKVRGFLAKPKDGQNLPGVILIHEWWGLNDNIKDLARQFAKEGYVALAVDLYDGQSTKDPAIAQKLAGSVRENMDPAFENLKAAVKYISMLSDVNKDRLASVGWCFGGGWAYQMAKNDMGVKASIMYYGQFSPADDLNHMKSTILGHFGEKDASIKVDNVREFQATLKTLSGEHEVYIYPNAGHGFANPDNNNYDPEAAKLAWERTMGFLKKVLK